MKPPEGAGSKLVRDIFVTIVCTVIAGLILSVIQTPFTQWSNVEVPQFGQFIAHLPLWLRIVVLVLFAVCVFLLLFGHRFSSAHATQNEASTSALPTNSAPLEVPLDTEESVDPYEPVYTKDGNDIALTFMITTTVAACILVARPTKFNPNRIQLADLQPMAKGLQVSNQGFLVPHEIAPPFNNLGDGIQKVFDGDGVREAYRLHSSGLLTYFRVNPDDVRNQNNYSAPRVMDFRFLMKTITATTLTARNLARLLLADNEKLSFEIRMNGLLGRTLVSDHTDAFPIQQTAQCHEYGFSFDATMTRTELESKAGALSTDCILKALWYFNHAEVSRDVIEDWQRGWVEDREPLAFPKAKSE